MPLFYLRPLLFVCSILNRRFRSSPLLSLLTVIRVTLSVPSGGASHRVMKLGYDVFQKLDDGSPLWIANVQTREQALEEVTSLRRSTAARYFVRDAETGVVINDCEPGTDESTNEGG
jgi:hypothetical protein